MKASNATSNSLPNLSTFLLTTLSLFTLIQPTIAKSFTTKVAKPPATTKIAQLEVVANQLFERGGCAVPCGWHDWLCCEAGQTCFTNAQDQAQCGGVATGGGGGGHWEYGTTTFTETDAVTTTSVYSTYVGSGGQATDPTTCTANVDITCGDGCCRSDQYCNLKNKCVPNAGALTTTGVGAATGSFSAPLRPTSLTTITATPTVPFETPVATGANVTLTSAESDNSGGLSGGAIAGIVIGVLFGLLLLLLLILFCCFKAAFDALLALFGLAGRRRRHTETEYIEEHHHHSGHGAAAAGAGATAGGLFGRRWYGDRPSRPERPPKKSGGLGGLGAMAAGLGGLAMVLGLKRKHDRKHDEKSTAYTGSSYYSSYYDSQYTSSSSESSSDRHTRHTRRSSRSRH